MADITLRNASAVATGSTSLTIDKPTNTVDGDIMIMVICVHDTTSKGSLPSGWTRFAETSSTNGTGFFAWKRASSEGSSYSVTGLADSSAGCILSFYNCIESGDPIAASVGRANASGAFGTAGITPGIANCMIVNAACVMDNYSLSSWTLNSVSMTERADGGSNTGSDTHVGAATLLVAASTATGDSSYTHTNFENVGLLCAVKPAINVTLTINDAGHLSYSDNITLTMPPPTEVTKTVKFSGGNYASLNLWEADRQGDITAAGRNTIEIAECYAFEDTTATAISSWTTDATHYVKITVPTAERHAGVWSNSKYRLSVDLASGTALSIETPYTRIEGIQLRTVLTGASGSTYGLAYGDSAVSGEHWLSHSIFTATINGYNPTTYRMVNVDTSGTTVLIKIWNCLIFDVQTTSQGTGFYLSDVSSGSYIYNCTARYCRWGYSLSADVIAKNCIAQDGNDGFYALTTYHASCSDNCSDITDDIPNASGYTGEVVFIDESGSDYRLSSDDTYAKDHGADLSGTFTDDICGNTRTGTWDIGASQDYVSGVTLVMSDAVHLHYADVPALVQASTLTMQDAVHMHYADSLALAQQNTLVVQDTGHLHYLDEPIVSETALLALLSASQAHYADNVILVQQNTLAVQDSSHSHYVDSPALVQQSTLQIQDSSHAHSADVLSLIENFLLVITDIGHYHYANGIVLSLPGTESLSVEILRPRMIIQQQQPRYYTD